MQFKLLTLASVTLMVAFASAFPMSNSDAGLEVGSITDNARLVRRVEDFRGAPAVSSDPSTYGMSDNIPPPPPPYSTGPAPHPNQQAPPSGQVDPKLEDKLKQEKPEAQQFLAEFLDMLKQKGKMLDKKEDQDKLKSCASQ